MSLTTLNDYCYMCEQKFEVPANRKTAPAYMFKRVNATIRVATWEKPPVRYMEATRQTKSGASFKVLEGGIADTPAFCESCYKKTIDLVDKAKKDERINT